MANKLKASNNEDNEMTRTLPHQQAILVVEFHGAVQYVQVGPRH